MGCGVWLFFYALLVSGIFHWVKDVRRRHTKCTKYITVSRSKSEAFRLFGIMKVSSQISLAFCGVRFLLELYPTHSCNSYRVIGGEALYMSILEIPNRLFSAEITERNDHCAGDPTTTTP